MSLLSWLRQRPPVPDLPEKCPACDSRLPLEALPADRFFCPGCAKTFHAFRDVHGDLVIDLTPERYKLRRPSVRVAS